MFQNAKKSKKERRGEDDTSRTQIFSKLQCNRQCGDRHGQYYYFDIRPGSSSTLKTGGAMRTHRLVEI